MLETRFVLLPLDYQISDIGHIYLLARAELSTVVLKGSFIKNKIDTWATALRRKSNEYIDHFVATHTPIRVLTWAKRQARTNT
jgi:hypothetical protein